MSICAPEPFGSKFLKGGYGYWPLWWYGQRSKLYDMSGHGVTLYPSGAYFDGQGYYFDGGDYLEDAGGRQIVDRFTVGSWHSIYLTEGVVPAKGSAIGTGITLGVNVDGASPKITGNFILRHQYCPNLENFYCNYNRFSNLDVSEIVTLKQLSCSFGILTTLDILNLSLLEKLWCIGGSLTYIDVSGKPYLCYLRLHTNSLSQEMVDKILCDMVDNGYDSGGSYLDIYNNTAPSETGEICKGILIDRGWTVVTD